MAIEILLILVISDEPERVFLGGHHTVLWERMQIDPKTLEKMECLKN